MIEKEKEKYLNNRTGIIVIIFLVVITAIFLCDSDVYAIDNSIIKETEYTEEYKKWLELSEEEKAKTIAPRKYEIRNSKAINLFSRGRITRSALVTKYDLRETIPENVVIRNQMSTGECWAFTGIAVLESNLALRDKLEGRGITVYDFSERHMDYSSATQFLNNEKNEYGYREDITLGGWWESSEMYLTNGRGAILEEDMPFENNQNIITLSEIQNKTVQTKVEDTAYFESPPNNDTLSTEYKEWQRQVKEHITKYGAVTASIYYSEEYDSNLIGSYYCNDYTQDTNHLVSIIGWDDEYSVDNFTGAAKPTTPGAWIVKNSWGDGGYTLKEWKIYMFGMYPDKFAENGWNTADDMPDSYATRQLNNAGYTYDSEAGKYYNDEYRYQYDGYWYISYEDVLVNRYLYGIKNAKTDVDYDNLYQHDIFGATYSRYISKTNISGDEKKIYLANVFNKNTDTVEKLNEVSIITNQSYICKVYVNPNGISKEQKDLQEISLQEGYGTVDAGYNTLKFKEPVSIIGDNFVVVIEVRTADSRESSIIISTEKNEYPVYTATFNAGESYLSYGEDFNNNSWIDMGTQYSENLCIKAFTTNGTDSIRVEKLPNKTEYILGSNFDTAGMVVMASINGKEIEITEYEVVNGTNLSIGQASVTITYEGKEVSVPITVSKAQGSISNIQNLSKVYDGIEVTEPSFTKVGDGQVRVEWYKLEATVPTKLDEAPTNAGTYKVKVILAEGTNYLGAEAEKRFTISKATYDMSNVTFEDKTFAYDGTEKRIEIEGVLPEGVSVAYENNTRTEVGQSIATAMFTGDSVNYNEIPSMTAILTISAQAGSISNITDISKTYDGYQVNNPNFDRVGDGEVTFEWYKIENDREILLNEAPTNAGTNKVKVKMAATENYTAAEAEKEFTISKANPTCSAPTGLRATYGDKLNTVELPQGYSFENITEETIVGNAGENTFTVTYTPKDTANYNTITGIEVKVEVAKAVPTYTVPENLTAEEGQTLANISLPEGFMWEQALTTNVGEVGTNTFTVTYTPEDTQNYEIKTGIEVKVTVTEKAEISTGDYEIIKAEDGKEYIEKISFNTSIENIKEQISEANNSNVEVKVLNKNGEEITEESKLATGMKIQIGKGQAKKEYEVVVEGDIVGDGKLDGKDLLRMARYKAGLDTTLNGAYLRATNIFRDNKFADNKDLLKLARIMAGLENL